jgi:2-C-methyl-D-erythritol 4-phosphate cytidylyltransferase
MLASLIGLAAGSGTRLGSDVPKAFVQIGGVTLLQMTLNAIRVLNAIEEIVIAAPSGMEQPATAIAVAARVERPVKVVTGGDERQDSVRIALEFTSTEAEIVVIHDAARPFATAAMFQASITAAAANGAAIAAIPLADTLKRGSDGFIRETVPRVGLWQAQTPQAFRRELLIRAHEHALQDGLVATDDSDLVERLGVQVGVVPGATTNLKITTPDDLRLAAALRLAET